MAFTLRYCTVREWAKPYVKAETIFNRAEYSMKMSNRDDIIESRFLSDLDVEDELSVESHVLSLLQSKRLTHLVIPIIRKTANVLMYDDYESLASNDVECAVELTRQFIQAFEVYDKYITISNEKDWNNPTIQSLLQQLTTDEEWDRIAAVPAAAYTWWHQEDRWMYSGIKQNPALATYNYELIKADHETLHKELLSA